MDLWNLNQWRLTPLQSGNETTGLAAVGRDVEAPTGHAHPGQFFTWRALDDLGAPLQGLAGGDVTLLQPGATKRTLVDLFLQFGVGVHQVTGSRVAVAGAETGDIRGQKGSHVNHRVDGTVDILSLHRMGH